MQGFDDEKGDLTKNDANEANKDEEKADESSDFENEPSKEVGPNKELIPEISDSEDSEDEGPRHDKKYVLTMDFFCI